MQVEPDPLPRSLRVYYEVGRVDEPPLDRWVICEFAAEGLSPNKSDLVRLLTEAGAVSEPSLSYLKRYYLGTPEGVAGDPGGGDLDARVLRCPPRSPIRLQQILVSLPRTAIYALLAAAYALVFGLVGRINLAFGELAAIGSAATVAGVADPPCPRRHEPARRPRPRPSLRARGGRAPRRGRRPFRIARIRTREQPGLASSRPSACRCS